MSEVCGSNPVIGKLLYRTFNFYLLYSKDENKEKEAGNCPFLKKNQNLDCVKWRSGFGVLGVLFWRPKRSSQIHFVQTPMPPTLNFNFNFGFSSPLKRSVATN